MCYSGPISVTSSLTTLRQASATEALTIVPAPSFAVSTALFHVAVSGNFVLSFLCLFLFFLA